MGHYVNFKEELQQRTDYAEEVIRRWLPEERGFSKTMAQAMNYSMCAGGKRLRPILLLETLRLFGGDEKLAEPFMAGIEMIHTHSLIHDDLPAIDNDDYRRGRLTTHKVYGEAMGVLSGVTLLNYAYETMFRAFELTDDKDRVIRAVRIMAEKTGIYGMLGGQVLMWKMMANHWRELFSITFMTQNFCTDRSVHDGRSCSGRSGRGTDLHDRTGCIGYWSGIPDTG